MTEDVFQVYQSLALALGKSTGSTIAEWLHDTIPAAISMTEQVRQIRRSPSVGMARVEAMVQASELLTSDVLNRAGTVPRGLAGGDTAPVADTLTPPSSNTGGKVGKSSKTPKGSK
jgi:hypothetical protein